MPSTLKKGLTQENEPPFQANRIVFRKTEPSLPYCLGRKGHTEPEMAFRCPAAGSSNPLNTAESEGHGASSRLGPGPGQVLDNLLSSCHSTLS